MSGSSEPDGGREVRRDIQALRALSVALVLVFHLSRDWLPGGFVGVDVFFVVSGYLVTRQLAGELREGRFSPLSFLERRARRLLPAALLVVLSTLGLTLLWEPKHLWQEIAESALAALIYAHNWYQVLKSADYFSETYGPLHHFWSLSVEEQYYLALPLLGALAYALRGKISPKKCLLLTLGLTALASFLRHLLLFTTAPELAYLGSDSRVFELALGGVAGLLLGEKRAPRYVPLAGLALILAAAVLLSEARLFPGFPLAVVAGTIAILWQSSAVLGSKWESLGALRPILWLGDAAYSIYLWHFPVIFFASRHLPHLSGLGRAATVTGITLTLSALSYLGVEQPFRKQKRCTAKAETWSRRGAFLVISILLLSSAALALTTMHEVASSRVRLRELANRPTRHPGEDPCYGSLALSRPDCLPYAGDGRFTPTLLDSQSEFETSTVRRECFMNQTEAGLRICRKGSRQALFHVALVGDSHAMQWAPALEVLAEQSDLRLTMMFRGRCPINLEKPVRRVELKAELCAEWALQVVQQLEGDDSIDLIITSARGSARWDPNDPQVGAERGAEGYLAAWKRITKQGSRPLLFLADTPTPVPGFRECLARGESTSCAKILGPPSLGSVQRHAAKAALRAAQNDAYHFADLSHLFCTKGTCPPVIGGLLVYSDESHVSPTYARTLASGLAEAAVPLLTQ